MSQETVDALREQRKAQIEESPFSETFQIVGGSTFKGIFNRANRQGRKDPGNVKPMILNPSIMVDSRPEGIIEHETIIEREDGVSKYTFSSYDTDEEGIPILWLF